MARRTGRSGCLISKYITTIYVDVNICISVEITHLSVQILKCYDYQYFGSTCAQERKGELNSWSRLLV